MNPLRFRLLSGKRVIQLLIPQLTPIGAILFLCLPSPGAYADESMGESFFHGEKGCLERFNSDEQSIYGEDGSTLKDYYDPAHNCRLNTGGETQSINATVLEKNQDILHGRTDFGDKDKKTKEEGICRLAFISVKDVFDHFVARQKKFCAELFSKLQEAQQCGGYIANCKEQWEAFRDVSKSYAEDLHSQTPLAHAYLTSLIKTANAAHDQYQADLEKLSPEMDKFLQSGSKKSLGSVLKDYPEVKASNGNKKSQLAAPSKALETYYTLLAGDGAANASSTLIQEEEIAAQHLSKFRDSLQSVLSDNENNAQKESDSVSSQIARINLNGSSTHEKSSISDDLGNVAPLASAASPFAGKSSDESGSSDSSGGSQSGGSLAKDAAPAAALAAAAGLGAAAEHNTQSQDGNQSDSSSQHGGANPNSQPSAPISNAEDPSGQGGTAAAKAQPHETAGGTNANAAFAKAGEPGINPAGYAGLIAADSNSRMGGASNRVPASNAPNGAGAVDTGGAGTPEMANSFGGNLSPKPAPKAAGTSPGSEVANLLDQMKNLFSFDGSAPMGGGPALPLASLPPPDLGGASPAPSLGDVAPVEGETQAQAPEPESAAETGQSEELQSNPFGKVDVTLFERIRARHNICMKRGLVLYSLKERIE